ncbi:MAG: guanylate kinase [Candidatus Omnitrophica bacterium]|nr:guanylate kinase [Candidatus Omnitrophota bacterium]MCM8808655.1 guanylate kinase [Candidatus Omnitrophota bacterium]MCM8810422.1 guanylate kinase [Candidatus Omnitrophota bacterium]MCM8833542.1 guanylate kinase [Candidatus Omnitrophota bacterium]
MKHLIFVLSAPSGTGKTTIQKLLKNQLKDIEIITTYTTRKPRKSEIKGVDYNFVSKKIFKKMIKNDQFAEWSIVYGNYYGTPKKEIEENLKKNKKMLLVIDTQGGLKIKDRYNNKVLLIGILPPSLKEQERRMRERKDMKEEEIQKRLSISKQERKILLEFYDIRLINKDIEKTVERIKEIILNN